MSEELTINQVKEVAEEVAKKEVLVATRGIHSELAQVKKCSKSNNEMLERIGRNLFGEEGADKDYTIAAKADFAFDYARKNVELEIVPRATKALSWYEDMAKKESGAKESKLDTLGRLLALFKNVEFMMVVFGVGTSVNIMLVVKWILETIQQAQN